MIAAAIIICRITGKRDRSSALVQIAVDRNEDPMGNCRCPYVLEIMDVLAVKLGTRTCWYDGARRSPGIKLKVLTGMALSSEILTERRPGVGGNDLQRRETKRSIGAWPRRQDTRFHRAQCRSMSGCAPASDPSSPSQGPLGLRMASAGKQGWPGRNTSS
jgi:hypothetical protein